MNLPDPGLPNLEFERPTDRAHLERTAAALAARGLEAPYMPAGATFSKIAVIP
jgi:hypothetical protein